MIVFAEKISNRLEYILNYVLNERLGINFQLSTNKDEYLEHDGAKINYSSLSLDGIQLNPATLLFEEHINNDKPTLKEVDGKFYLYPQAINNDLGFDVLAACFWMLSRYEEYQSFQPDAHHRFSATESFAFKNGFLNQPVVDYWIIRLGQAIKVQYSELKLKQEQFEILPTIDVDSPWCYKNKGLVRNLGGTLRDVLNNRWDDVLFRWQVVFGLKPDPHFVFEPLQQFYEENELKPLYFLHVGSYGAFDKTITIHKRAFKLFLAKITFQNAWGIHPSYQASDDNDAFKNELKRLNKVSGEKVLLSRHHYLKIKLPESYQYMIEQGIAHDYTMGFADKVGFRAGSSRSFLFFDLNRNETTTLRVHPFVLMDRTLNTYENLSEQEVLHLVKEIIDSIKEVNGTFVSLWHNESLSNYHEWKGWKSVYEKMLKIAMEK